jgi:hypothetical protein
MAKARGTRAAIGRAVACGAAALVAPVIGLLACSSSTQGARDAGAPTDSAADRAADLASATDATDALPSLGAYVCPDEPGDGGSQGNSDGAVAVVDASHRCNANQSFCLIQALPPGAGGGSTGQCLPFDIGDASAACAAHPVCACASASRLANCTCSEVANTVTVRCGPV